MTYIAGLKQCAIKLCFNERTANPTCCNVNVVANTIKQLNDAQS